MTKIAAILHVDQVKVEGGASWLRGGASWVGLVSRLSWANAISRTWPAFLNASAGSTSPRCHSSTSSLKTPSDPVLPVGYVVSANLVTVAIQFCLVSHGTRLNFVWVLAQRVHSMESTGGGLYEI